MDQNLLDILVCPITHSKLRRDGDFLISAEGTRYPIKDGLPVLLPEAATLPEGLALQELQKPREKK